MTDIPVYVGENALAPGFVMAIVCAERLMDCRAEVLSQLFEFGAQLFGG